MNDAKTVIAETYDYTFSEHGFRTFATLLLTICIGSIAWAWMMQEIVG